MKIISLDKFISLDIEKVWEMNNHNIFVKLIPEEGKTHSQIFSGFNQKNNFEIINKTDLITTYSNKTTLNLEFNII